LWRGGKFGTLFNVAKKSGIWTDYKRSLTDNNKALWQAKRESWRRQCEKIEQAPGCARLQKILSKDVQSAVKWAVKEGLKISPHKTAIVPFTNRRNVEGLGPLIPHGKELKMLGEVKYLGVILDSKLSWNQHLQKILRKAETTFTVARRMYGTKWGLRPTIVCWLNTRVIRPSIFHAALVWWPKIKQKSTKTQLGRIQRMACLAITGATKSTPTAALGVLLNLTPLDLLIMAEARMALYRLQIYKQLNVP
jgi:hypothetical protein